MATGRVPTTANSPLTTKGDLFTYDTSQARLAVGSNGETLVADSSQSVGLRYNPQNALVNSVINGGADIWQRGTTFTVTTPVYTADRWQVGRGSNASGLTVTRQTTGDTTNLPNIQYCIRSARDSGNTGTQAMYLSQSFETVNSLPYAGKTITYSFYARKGANYSAVSDALILRSYTGTGTDQNVLTAGYTGSVQTNTTFTLTATWQRFAVSVAIPSTATEIGFFFDFAPSGTAGAADYYEMTGFQIDLGTYTASTAPTFRRSGGTIAGELAACQRYYQRYNFPTATGGGTNVGVAVNTTIFDTLIIPPVAFRVKPTAIDSLTLSMYYPPAAGQYNTGTFTIASFSTANHIDIRYTHGTGVFTAGVGGFLTSSGNDGYLGLTAEL